MTKSVLTVACALAFSTMPLKSAQSQKIPQPPATSVQPAGPTDPVVIARTAAIDAGDTSPEAREVLKLERDIEAAVVRGDVAYVSSKLSNDFIMVHGDTWILDKPLRLADNKASFLKRVEDKQYLFREISTSKVEMHGDIALTFGQYTAENKPGASPLPWFSVRYERVFARRNGQWVMVSHRTVSGPHYGSDRMSVK
jgi:hypothetical protein